MIQRTEENPDSTVTAEMGSGLWRAVGFFGLWLVFFLAGGGEGEGM